MLVLRYIKANVKSLVGFVMFFLFGVHIYRTGEWSHPSMGRHLPVPGDKKVVGGAIIVFSICILLESAYRYFKRGSDKKRA